MMTRRISIDCWCSAVHLIINNGLFLPFQSVFISKRNSINRTIGSSNKNENENCSILKCGTQINLFIQLFQKKVVNYSFQRISMQPIVLALFLADNRYLGVINKVILPLFGRILFFDNRSESKRKNSNKNLIFHFHKPFFFQFKSYLLAIVENDRISILPPLFNLNLPNYE